MFIKVMIPGPQSRATEAIPGYKADDHTAKSCMYSKVDKNHYPKYSYSMTFHNRREIVQAQSFTMGFLMSFKKLY